MEGRTNIPEFDDARETPIDHEAKSPSREPESAQLTEPPVAETLESQPMAAALRLAEAGIPVFPATISYDEKSASWRKKPRFSEWQKWATTDSAMIKNWWSLFPNAAPAIALGKANLVVVDPDRHGDIDGVANFAKLIEGHDLPVGPIINTAGGGKHYIFRQPESGEPLGNRKGDLPDGIDVRGNGGFVIAVGAVRPDGAVYAPDEHGPDLAEAFRNRSIPVLPEFLERVIRTKRPSEAITKTQDAGPRPAPTAREEAYARATLDGCATELENATKGGRNNLLNTVAYRMGRLIAAGWIDKTTVIERLGKAAKSCGLVAEDGVEPVLMTINSGLRAAAEKPHPPLGPRVKQAVAASPTGITVLWPGRSKNWPVAKWLIDDMIPENTTGLIVGESGAGKTFVALHLAGSLAVGKPFFGKKINARGGTVYVCAEGSFSIHDRIKAEFSGSISPHLKSDAGSGREMTLSDMPIPVFAGIHNLNDDGHLDEVIGKILAAADEMQERHGLPLRLVIIDTMLAGVAIDDWNNPAQAQRAMAVLSKIAQATGATTIGVHHHGKDKSRGPTGSYALTATADFILSVYRDAGQAGGGKRRWITVTKSRGGEAGSSCDFDLVGVIIDADEHGDEKTCAFVEPRLDTSHNEEVNDGKTTPESKGSTAFKQVFADAVKSGRVIEFDDGKYRGTLKALLRDRFDGCYAKSEDANRKAFTRALKSAIDDSAIIIKSKDGEDWVCEPTPVEASGKLFE
jgi:RecA/RadA recombinase